MQSQETLSALAACISEQLSKNTNMKRF